MFLEPAATVARRLLPIDSEHNALFQCLPPRPQRSGALSVRRAVSRLILTASGGPFRERAVETLDAVTPQEACAHPNWAMGRKISVDSATMMNKGLELIEAHFLFDMPADRLEVLIHPQSIVHSLVEYVDGSMLAQLGNPDMRIPDRACARLHRERIERGGAARPGRDRAARFRGAGPEARFPCLRLARRSAGGRAAVRRAC